MVATGFAVAVCDGEGDVIGLLSFAAAEPKVDSLESMEYGDIKGAFLGGCFGIAAVATAPAPAALLGTPTAAAAAAGVADAMGDAVALGLLAALESGASSSSPGTHEHTIIAVPPPLISCLSALTGCVIIALLGLIKDTKCNIDCPVHYTHVMSGAILVLLDRCHTYIVFFSAAGHS